MPGDLGANPVLGWLTKHGTTSPGFGDGLHLKDARLLLESGLPDMMQEKLAGFVIELRRRGEEMIEKEIRRMIEVSKLAYEGASSPVAPFSRDDRVHHPEMGDGTVVDVNSFSVSIRFDRMPTPVQVLLRDTEVKKIEPMPGDRRA